MRDRDWFILGCRLFGVWVAYTGFTYIAGYFYNRLGQADAIGERPGETSGLLVYAGFHLLIALYLLLGTRHLAWLCYQEDGGSKPAPTTLDLAPPRDLA